MKHLKQKSGRKSHNKKMSVVEMIVLDILAICVGLVIFALFHHVLPHYGILTGREIEPVVLATLAPQPVAAPVETPIAEEQEATPPEEVRPEETPPQETPDPVRVYSGVWGEKFADKFTDGEVIQTENSYRSANVNVSYERVEEEGIIYFVADVYVSDLGYLRSGFGNGKYNGGFQMIDVIAQQEGAIAAISGDHYAGRAEGMVVRNGVLYRDTRYSDVCVLYSDGTMDTMTNAEFDPEIIKAAAPYQVWAFGPELLDEEGHAKDNSRNVVFRNNPRSAIGYVEPGHYYLVEVEGSRTGAWSGSRGMTMQELSELFESLGCKTAYNLDGGRSVGFAWMGERISYNYDRSIPDIIYVADFLLETDETAEQAGEG